MINLPEFIFKDLNNDYVRENFKRLNEFIQNYPFFRGNWRFFEVNITKAETNLKINHGLNFKPKDVIQTSIIGPGSITFNYSLFSHDTIDITTTDACEVRFFLGSYKEESSRLGR